MNEVLFNQMENQMPNNCSKRPPIVLFLLILLIPQILATNWDQNHHFLRSKHGSNEDKWTQNDINWQMRDSRERFQPQRTVQWWPQEDNYPEVDRRLIRRGIRPRSYRLEYEDSEEHSDQWPQGYPYDRWTLFEDREGTKFIGPRRTHIRSGITARGQRLP